jgi:hypothetical protein
VRYNENIQSNLASIQNHGSFGNTTHRKKTVRYKSLSIINTKLFFKF